MILLEWLTVILGYVLGSIPFGLIISRRYAHIDITKQGSGNIGSTNVKRVVGRKLALITQVLDVGKGSVAVLIAMWCYMYDDIYSYDAVVFVALAVICGHDFSLFLKFKGGKGVNTTVGAFAVLMPLPVVMGVVTYFIFKWQFKYVSVGSLALAMAIPFYAYIGGYAYEFIVGSILASALIFIRHHSNIRRLFSGSENL